MDIQAITYRGRTVAACTRRRFFLSDDIADRDPNDPLVSFVIGMCLYARLVAAGDMPGPYTDDDARAYARDCLIPDELLDRADSTSRASRHGCVSPRTSFDSRGASATFAGWDASATPPAGALHVALVSADGTERALRLA